MENCYIHHIHSFGIEDIKMEIPKVINYCWFGNGELSPLEKRCIDSWKKYCPDYKIIQWNEENFDIHQIPYMEQAYEKGKWAFVSDLARYLILYKNGGLYFDTDVELTKPINDVIENGPFFGWEDNKYANEPFYVNPGLGMAAYAGMPFYKTIIEYYKNHNFIDESGRINQKTVCLITTELLENDGMKSNGALQNIDGIVIYPIEYFCPMNKITGSINITNNTVSIHHYSMSWQNKYERKIVELIRKYSSTNIRAYNILDKFKMVIYKISNKAYKTIYKQ